MIDEHELALDDAGDLVLVQRPVPGEPARDVPTASGNPAHGTASGTFKSRPKNRKEPHGGATEPPVADGPRSDEERRRDAIVDAARTLEDLSPDGVRELVIRRWRGARPLTQDDIDAFARDAQIQRTNDLVDSLDARMRKLTQSQSAKIVKVDVPRAWVRRTFRALDDTTVIRVLQRLRERGWSAKQIQQHVVKPFDDERKRMVVPAVGLEGD